MTMNTEPRFIISPFLMFSRLHLKGTIAICHLRKVSIVTTVTEILKKMEVMKCKLKHKSDKLSIDLDWVGLT